MSTWRSYHVYHADVDRVILDLAHPYLERVRDRLERCWWERHYAGGPHLRVRLRGPAPVVEEAGAEFQAAAGAWLAVHPGPDDARYDPDRAALLLSQEGADPAQEDLAYRNNQVVQRPYPAQRQVYASEEAALLAEDFRDDMMPLAAAILRGDRPVREQMLRLYFLHALALGGGELPRGSVSFKSHWEGFASTLPSEAVITRIQEVYRAHREGIVALMLEVADRWNGGGVDDDAVLGGWKALIDAYGRRAREALRAGTHITAQPASVGEAARLRDRMFGNVRRESEFVRTLWTDHRFIASLQYEPGFLVPRVLTNLLYLLLAAVGLAPLDKMALCHHAHRAPEEHFGRDLNEILRENVDTVVRAHAHRLDA
ncbi:MAG TPA: lantibiotic dehydratase C-terminal domain-containing protein [Longimicrobium sp.]|nr:lantibiotic dehydratase C-terminal domain-containing protein [Longimicrobium sp.]